MFNKFTEHQLRQSLKAMTGDPVSLSKRHDIPAVFAALVNSGNLNLPVDHSSLFVCPERFPLFADIQHPRKSLLMNQLLDRPDETGVVVDSIYSGKDAVFVAHLLTELSDATAWIACMNCTQVDVTIKSMNEEYILIISKLKAFVTPRVDD